MSNKLDLDELERTWRDTDRHTAVPKVAFDLIAELRACRSELAQAHTCEEFEALEIDYRNAEARIAAALELHEDPYCGECGDRDCCSEPMTDCGECMSEWPCRTYRALTGGDQ